MKNTPKTRPPTCWGPATSWDPQQRDQKRLQKMPPELSLSALCMVFRGDSENRGPEAWGSSGTPKIAKNVKKQKKTQTKIKKNTKNTGEINRGKKQKNT